MKIKGDFVTNSSSTCYIGAVYKVEDIFKLKEYLRRSYGELGDKIATNNIMDLKGVLDIFDIGEDKYQKGSNSYFFQFCEECATVEEITNKLEEGSSYLAVNNSSPNYEAPDIEPIVIFNIKPEDAGLKLIDKHCYVGMEF